MAKSKKTRKLKLGPKATRSRSAGRRKASPARQQAIIREATTWPVMECLIAEEWREQGAITQVVVARQSPTGYVAVAAFVVDLGCLGVKNALTVGFVSRKQYQQEYRSAVTSSQPMVACDLDLAAKVVFKAIEYAESLGFKPHPDSREALILLQDARPEDCDEEIPVGGEDGQPFYVSGPYDDVDQIRATLDRTVGPGNYNFLVVLGEPFADFDEVDE